MTKYFLDLHGCAKNQVDSELIVSYLTCSGFMQTFNPAEAQFIIINSCGFIESAKKESLGALLAAKKQFPTAKIILAGCLAERYAEVFKEELPEADGIFGNGDISQIGDFMKSVAENHRSILKPPQKNICCRERDFFYNFRRSAYIKITEGCNNWCSFCAIPLIRGELRSRDAVDITDEIKSLVSHGIYEINLVGQDLAAYGTGSRDSVFGEGILPLPELAADPLKEPFTERKKSGLVRLIEKVSKIKENFRLRLLYIHPDHFDINILNAVKSDSRIVPYFDIPFQSGSDSVIKLMNRKGSFLLYADLVRRIRAELPDSAIRTTFLTGFPGETEKDFENTIHFLQTIKPDWSGCFSYSPEEGTKGFSLKNRVPQKIAEKRAEKLTAVQSAITRECLVRRVGKQYDVLVEEVIPGAEGLAIGRAWFQAPDVDGSVVIRYDRGNQKEYNAVQPGNVVSVKAVSSSEVDIDSVFLAESPVVSELRKDTCRYFCEQE